MGRHPWETVVQATWRKYPNPMNPSVRGIDVINRTVDSNGVLKSHRLLTTTFNIPSWVSRYLPYGNSMFGSEHSQVDPRNKMMKLRTKNLTLSSLLSIEEQLCYKQHPEDKNKTLLTQEAVVTVKGIPLSSYLEGVVTDTIDSNAGKGRQAMEWVISRLKTEALDLKVEAQKCMDNVLPNLELKVEAQKCMDNVLPPSSSSAL